MKSKGKLALSSIAAVAFISPLLLHSFLGIGISPILTNSMKPYAAAGDIFITKNAVASDLKVGDIISVDSKLFGGFYAHRITAINTSNGLLNITTKGDANSSPEATPFISSKNYLVPRNVLRIPLIGRPLVYLTSKPGRSLGYSFLILANVLALFAFIFRVKKVMATRSEEIYKSLYLEEKAKHEVQRSANFGKRGYINNEVSNSNQEVMI
ncbi:unannotated protein [freshwater metagenome]|uniref:Unannotated protein n=1 Tax=freshwater metagenome TaxID=449393 RepID=A0A6J6BEM6_9ZZZZ|nr:signal peptidase I [Actinomycetota bacterium]MSW14818.1 signal peptidase I [Actinomycetota bacterium]MSW98912.1 signal peptidase I [Actinomycetota bacterium]MSY82583.1 signal peptidase I [Actinomycetota bacterium]MSZ45697.1 signal peptidase I [Actinomycetota bacterium]